MERKDENWDLIVRPERKLFDLQLRDVVRYRDLVLLFIKRDFVTQFKQTLLGPAWYVINPIFSTIMYAFVFGNLAKIGTDGVPHLLFYYSGTMLWTFFSSCFMDASNIFLHNSSLFGKVYFPRFTVPISNIVGNLMKAGVQFLMLILFFLFYIIKGSSIQPSFLALAFPLLFAWIAASATGMGMVISSLTTKYRDLSNLVSFALGLAMYITPVVYPLSEIPVQFAWVNYLNPVSAPIELFRVWFYGAGYVSPAMIICSVGISLFFLMLGLVMFNQNERNFIDVI